MDGDAVVDDVQAGFLEVDDAAAGAIFDVGVADVPLFGDGPVKDSGARGNFEEVERDALLNQFQGLADAIAGNAAANGIKFGGKLMKFAAESGVFGTVELCGEFHGFRRSPDKRRRVRR